MARNKPGTWGFQIEFKSIVRRSRKIDRDRGSKGRRVLKLHFH